MGDVGEQKDDRFGASRFDGALSQRFVVESDEDQETNPADDRSYDTTDATSDPLVSFEVTPGIPSGVKSYRRDVREHLKTTVMLKNVPPNYNRSKLLKLLDDEGFNTFYDFVYVPVGFKKKTKLGYAFVNMIDHASAIRFMCEFEGLSDWQDETPTAKPAQTCWGKIHCKTGHINRYRDSPLMHPNVPDEYKPMVFENGVQFPFPLPYNAKRMQLPRAVQAGQPSPCAKTRPCRQRHPAVPQPHPPLRLTRLHPSESSC